MKNNNVRATLMSARNFWVKTMVERFRADEASNPAEIGVLGINGTTIVVYGDSVANPKIGVSKCSPDDKFNLDMGVAIAYARAVGEKVPDYVIKDFNDIEIEFLAKAAREVEKIFYKYYN